MVSSEQNLLMQLAIPRHLRRGFAHSFGSGVNPNPKLWKYRWRIFVTRRGDSQSRSKENTQVMPEMAHADFLYRVAWLRREGIEFSFLNTRQRREHPLWNADTVASENLAPAYGNDSDPVASDGHR